MFYIKGEGRYKYKDIEFFMLILQDVSVSDNIG